MTAPRRRTLSLADYAAGVRAGDRAILGRAITLVESSRPADRLLAEALLQEVQPDTGRADRVGISGVPGAGKSTLIEALGRHLTGAGHRVAVLAVDPSSTVSGGSILGDKTRMGTLAVDPAAFIRPSPSAGSLGGVGRRTREAMALCEAAGFDVVLVETVGVGQSETLVADMVDFFLVVLIAGAGDELQGIKRGILELADLIAINKADGDNVRAAERARREHATALHLMRPVTPSWTPPVLTCSARHGQGVAELWREVAAHRERLTATGERAARRRSQLVSWMWRTVHDRLMDRVQSAAAVQAVLSTLEHDVRTGRLSPSVAASRILGRAGLLASDERMGAEPADR